MTRRERRKHVNLLRDKAQAELDRIGAIKDRGYCTEFDASYCISTGEWLSSKCPWDDNCGYCNPRPDSHNPECKGEYRGYYASNAIM